MVLECGSIDDTIRIKYACVKFVQGKGETSAISAIRSRTRYKGMERTMQWKSSRSAWNQLRERMARSLYSFAFSRHGTKRAWITRHRKTRTSLPPPSRNPFMQISTASHLTPLKPRAWTNFHATPVSLWTLKCAINARYRVFADESYFFFLLFLEKLGKKARRRREGN